MEKINLEKIKKNKKSKFEIASKKNLLTKKKEILTYNLLLSFLILIFLSISLSNEKKISKLRNLEKNYSEISIIIKGGSTQYIISSSSTVKPIEVSINGFIKNSAKAIISNLDKNNN